MSLRGREKEKESNRECAKDRVTKRERKIERGNVLKIYKQKEKESKRECTLRQIDKK
jgi:hypothetical protein